MSKVEDWRCGYHNRRLGIIKGRMVCDDPSEGGSGVCMIIQPDEVETVLSMDGSYVLLSYGGVLRNAMNPIVVHDDDLPHIKAGKIMRQEWLNNILNPDATKWWHLYGGDMYVLPESDDEHHKPMWTTAMVGPVLEDAHSVLPGTGHVVSLGIDLDSGGHTSHLALLGSWTHDPTEQEKKDAEGKGLAAQIVRKLHAGDVRTQHARDVDAAGPGPIVDV